MRILVTRPEPECGQWVQDLRDRGLAAEALPLLRIGAVRDGTQVQRCWQGLDRFQALMFVSGAAARHFFDARPPGTRLGAATRFWAPGPGTAAVLARLGVPATQIDAPQAGGGQFDSEALWRRVAPQVQPGWQVLIVRGAEEPAADASAAGDHGPGEGRDWLARVLADAGAAVRFLVAYERGAPAWTAPQRTLARTAASDGTLWLFTSSQAIDQLLSLLPGQRWQQARALATHPRIAQAARDAGFGDVRESRPRLDDVVASIESGG